MSSEVREAIEKREENFPEGLLKAKESLLEDAKDDAKAAEASLLLTEVCFWLGDYSEDNADKDKYFKEGVDWGKVAVEKNPDNVAAHMWYASNMGQHGLVQGIVKSAMYMGPIEKHGKKSVELDETFFYAAPLRLMGRFYHQAPGFPIGPGSNSKAEKMLKKAIEIAPEFAYNQLYMADLLISKSKKKEARELLEKVKAMQPLPGMAKLHERVLKEADKLLAKV